MVPVNTIISAVILGKMYGPVVILCYLTMLGLLALQYVSNKRLANLQFENCKVTDQRIAIISDMIKGIKQIKIRMQENKYIQKVNSIRN